MLVGEF